MLFQIELDKIRVAQTNSVVRRPWDSVIATMGEWDRKWAEACFKMTTNPWNASRGPLLFSLFTFHPQVLMQETPHFLASKNRFRRVRNAVLEVVNHSFVKVRGVLDYPRPSDA